MEASCFPQPVLVHHCACSSPRFYASQPVIGHIEKSVLMDDVKRREREAKERASEANMLDSLYQVCAGSTGGGPQGMAPDTVGSVPATGH